MCGIVAAAAGNNIVPVLVEGLKKLEYRGYDSAGLAVIEAGSIARVRSVGRVPNWKPHLPTHNPSPALPTPAGRPMVCHPNAMHTHMFPAPLPSSTTASSKTTSRCAAN
jgi:glucosamine--fructose-6-phosphate aminotransferase (isomerizing)